jgi:hypothetical protein
VQKRFLLPSLIALSLFTLLYSCSKFDTTDIGSDLLPVVDNVNTFDTLITVNATQFINSNDSSIVTREADHVLGRINNDPLVGATIADIYAQFKPTFYPFYYGNAKDTIVGLDSAVLCLSYKSFWGDSMQPIQLTVYAIPNLPGGNGQWDSIQDRDIRYAPALGSGAGTPVGSKLVDVRTLGNYTVFRNKKDSFRNQIRIPLTGSFATDLLTRDSLLTGNNTYRNDSSFRAFTKGFAIRATGAGNGLIYTNLTDTSSRVEIHFRKKNGGPVDTSYSSLRLYTPLGITGRPPSATVNNIVRNRAGSQMASPASTDIYLQASPGSHVKIAIPDLATVSNRIIHRAELIVEQVPSFLSQDKYFTEPNILYLDLKDTSTNNTDRWKPLYFDLNPNVFYDPDAFFSYFPTGGIDYFYHGGYPRYKADPVNPGGSIVFYNFNITRYVQRIITQKATNYEMRLQAPYIINYPQYGGGIGGGNAIAKGRIRIGSGTNANYKMRLRLVFSKI